MGRGDFSSHVNFFCSRMNINHEPSFTLYRDTVSPLLVRATLCLCEQVGRRMRKAGYRGKV